MILQGLLFCLLLLYSISIVIRSISIMMDPHFSVDKYNTVFHKVFSIFILHLLLAIISLITLVTLTASAVSDSMIILFLVYALATSITTLVVFQKMRSVSPTTSYESIGIIILSSLSLFGMSVLR